MSSVPRPSNKDERLITILSIDGGGMRGVIPGYILAVLEAELQNLDGKDARIADYFDYIAGTSTGGIMAAILTTPYQNGRPRVATEINKFYRESCSNVFSHATGTMSSFLGRSGKSKSWMMKVGEWAARAVTPAFYPQYDSSYLQQHLRKYLREIRLVDTLTNVVIPTYDLNSLHPVIFSTQQAKKTNSKIKMEDVIMGTIAAPTYFQPHQIEDNGQKYVLVDGGLAANNPTLLAIGEATRIIENSSNQGEYRFLVLSLGTGSAKLHHQVGYGGPLNWMDKSKGLSILVDVLMRATDDMVDIYSANILAHYKSLDNFFRIQDNTLNPDEVKLNDASKANVDKLEGIAKELLEKRSSTDNPETSLQYVPSDPFFPTNYDKITYFARKLSIERRQRHFRKDFFLS